MPKHNNSNRKVLQTKKQKNDPESSDSDTESDSTFNTEDCESDQDSYKDELNDTLQQLFPSKYLNEKLKQKKQKNQMVSMAASSKKKSSSTSNKKSKNKDTKKNSKKQVIDDSDSDSDSNDDNDESIAESSVYETDSNMDENDESEYETVDSSEEYIENTDSEDEEENKEKEKDFKITLMIGGQKPMLRSTSNLSKDEEYTSEDEKTFMRESYEPVGLPMSPSFESMPITPTSSSLVLTKSKKSKKEKPEFNDIDIEDQYKEIVELKKVLYDKYKKNFKNKIIKKAMDECDLKIKKLIKNARSKNAKAFEELLYKTDTQENTDELGYFKKKLSNKEQLSVMRDLRELHTKVYVEKPYLLTLLQSSLPTNLKAMALQRINQLASMEPGEPEYYKLKNWVDGFMRIPFNQYKNTSISIKDGIDKCSDFIVNAKTQLDNCVYGLNDAKMQIMQMIGQWISNPSALGTAIAVKGPPGTGKTSLIKDGVSKILGREFAFIALGGCGDSSYLEGHSYTYEGSTYGKIVQILMDSKCMNPVIYFDELDKVSDTARGQEIISLLTHLTDTTQNSQFRDKYFSEVDFDLSKCLFIFSYNDENLVNPILKDRMYRIQTKGYDLKEKMIIARNYMLPKIRSQVGFNEEDIIITDEVLSHIISNQAKGEDGVRTLKRCLEIIYTKLNLYRLVKTGTQLFEKEMGLQVTFPYTLTKKDVDTLIKVEESMKQSVLCSMYV